MTAKITKAEKTTYYLLEIPINEVLSKFKLNKIFDPNLSDRDFEYMVNKQSPIDLTMYSFVGQCQQDKDGKVYVSFGIISQTMRNATNDGKLVEEKMLKCKDPDKYWKLESRLELIKEVLEFLTDLRNKFKAEKKLLDFKDLNTYGPATRMQARTKSKSVKS